MICAVPQCVYAYDIQPVRFTLRAPTTKTVSQPEVTFDLELCAYHREAFDSAAHSIYVRTRVLQGG